MIRRIDSGVEAGANDYISKPVELIGLGQCHESAEDERSPRSGEESRKTVEPPAVEERTASLRQSESRCSELYEDAKSRAQLYHSFLSASPDAVIIYDMDGKTEYVSPSFTRIFGWTLGEVAGKRFRTFPDSERESTLTAIRKILKEGYPVSDFETRRLCKGGPLLDVSIAHLGITITWTILRDWW